MNIINKALCTCLSVVTLFSASIGSFAQEKNISFESKLIEAMPKDRNYFFSPFSIKTALSMALNGADGNTYKEIAQVLDIKDLSKYNESVQALIKRYLELKSVDLEVANSIWVNNSQALNKCADFSNVFKDIILSYYYGMAKKVNDTNAISEINNWISQRTHGKINNVLDNPEFVSCLVNTIYFSGKWKSPFESYMTYLSDFTDVSGKSSLINFMHKTDRTKYFEDSNLKAISLPYKDNDINMYVVLPNNGYNVNMETLDCIMDKMKFMRTEISLPKIHTEFSIELSKQLKQMGILTGFSDSANFLKMLNVPENIKLDQVIHKTYVDINESGTEAAAATVISMAKCCLEPPAEAFFDANKPFYYFIRDDKSNTVLFMGRYAFSE